MQQVKGHFRSGKWIPQYSREEKRLDGPQADYLVDLFEDELGPTTKDQSCRCPCTACKECKE